MPSHTINKGSNICVLSLKAFAFLSQISLTIKSHVHDEGEKSFAAVPAGANHTDIGPVVSPLDTWQFGHGARVWLFLALQGNAARCYPGDLGDGKVRINSGNQPQGALLRNGCSGGNGD